jgi:hypothetical protein
MLRRKVLGLMIGLLTLAATAATAETLKINMVKASNKGDRMVDAKLKPFENLLKSNLPFKRFELVDSKSLSLPGDKTVPLKDYALSCSGSAANLTIKVAHKGKQVMNSKVSIEAGKPLIVGGFPDAADKGARVLLILSVGK